MFNSYGQNLAIWRLSYTHIISQGLMFMFYRAYTGIWIEETHPMLQCTVHCGIPDCKITLQMNINIVENKTTLTKECQSLDFASWIINV